MSASTKTKNIGRITQIIGPVLDVTFPAGQMPNIQELIFCFSFKGQTLDFNSLFLVLRNL